MELFVISNEYKRVAIVDNYESLIWIERYNRPGEFELYTAAEQKYLDTLKCGYFLTQKYTRRAMIIENIKIETDTENGNHFIFSGRSVESILDRRIVYKKTVVKNKSIENTVKKLMKENVLTPENEDRKISEFEFERSWDDFIEGTKITAQYTGDNLLELIEEICDSFSLGFKVDFADGLASGNFSFQLYKGEDRSYAQSEHTYVVFSDKFDNLISTNYTRSLKDYKNVTLVAGEDEGVGEARKTLEVAVGGGSYTGIERRELYTDARDIQSTDEEGEVIPEEQYYAQLKQRGEEKLAEKTEIKQFEAKLDPYQTFKYGEDYFLGDIIQIRNEYGISSSARVTEYVMSDDTSDGTSYYPTFEIISD